MEGLRMSGKGLISFFWSTVGRKLVIALTGLSLFFFIIAHLTGNFTLVFGGSKAFNAYAYRLTSLGPLLYLVEFLLAATFIFHLTLAIITTLQNRTARKDKYIMLKSAGRVSKKTVSSRSMIYSGIIIVTFTIIHLITFKYGPGIKEGYVTVLGDENVRDLFRLVVEEFQKEWYVLWYVFAMIFLGFHLRHGFWSAFQSLGMNNPALSRVLYPLGLLIAIILGFGFILLPLYIYLVY
jgi:succinate dehydrogenase / fumarate reductase cytochrome b subunit